MKYASIEIAWKEKYESQPLYFCVFFTYIEPSPLSSNVMEQSSHHYPIRFID